MPVRYAVVAVLDGVRLTADPGGEPDRRGAVGSVLKAVAREQRKGDDCLARMRADRDALSAALEILGGVPA